MMLKSFLVAFVALATVQTADAQSTKEFLPLQNPGSGKCIVKGPCSSDGTTYALKLGSCTDKNAANLRHIGKGKEIRTADKLCIDTKVSATDKVGAEIVLRKCPPKCTSKSMLWTKVGRNQWQNGNKLCMEYSTKSKKFQQCECATLASNDKTSYQQWKFVKAATPPPPPPPPPPAQISCAEWGKKWVCGNGWLLNTQPGLTCVGATGSSCADVCCYKANTCKSEGLGHWSCPEDYRFVDRQCSNPGQKRCSWQTCCDYVPPPPPPPRPRTCKSEGFANACPADYVFVNVQCGNKGQPRCSVDTCCEYNPTPVRCTSWNRCSRGWELKPRARDIFCVRGPSVPGPDYAPTCSDDICCDPKPVDPVPTTCGRWNRCDAGYVVDPDAKYEKCHTAPNPPFTGPNAAPPCSNDLCCIKKVTPPPPPPPKPEYEATTCGAWNKCDNGFELWTNPFNRKCYVPSSPAVPPSDVLGMCTNQYCCLIKPPATQPAPPAPAGVEDSSDSTTTSVDTGVPETAGKSTESDTCKDWSERVVDDPLTGAEVCARADQWAGLMDSADEQFEQPCMEDGEKVECSAKLCCIPL